MSTDYAGLVEYIVKNIVEHPDAVEVDGSARRQRSQTVEIRLDPSDVGRVIGKGGKNIEAIRSVVKAAAIKDHQRVNVEVITEDGDYGTDEAEPYGESAGAPEPEAEATGEAEAVTAGGGTAADDPGPAPEE